MENTTQDNVSEVKQNDSGLKLGQFRAKFKSLDNSSVEYVILKETKNKIRC